jgi:hypothetical protein
MANFWKQKNRRIRRGHDCRLADQKIRGGIVYAGGYIAGNTIA